MVRYPLQNRILIRLNEKDAKYLKVDTIFEDSLNFVFPNKTPDEIVDEYEASFKIIVKHFLLPPKIMNLRRYRLQKIANGVQVYPVSTTTGRTGGL